jgi:hypothetical protein
VGEPRLSLSVDADDLAQLRLETEPDRFESPEIEQRIAACTDPAVLSRWLERAVTAESAADVLC